MNYHVLTLFPDMILEGLNTSIIGRAMAKGIPLFGGGEYPGLRV